MLGIALDHHLECRLGASAVSRHPDTSDILIGLAQVQYNHQVARNQRQSDAFGNACEKRHD
jgi:hypothetical protein